MNTETPERVLIDLLEEKLAAMLIDYRGSRFHKNSSLEHLAEMVKLAHQIRSLETRAY